MRPTHQYSTSDLLTSAAFIAPVAFRVDLCLPSSGKSEPCTSSSQMPEGLVQQHEQTAFKAIGGVPMTLWLQRMVTCGGALMSIASKNSFKIHHYKHINRPAN